VVVLGEVAPLVKAELQGQLWHGFARESRRGHVIEEEDYGVEDV